MILYWFFIRVFFSTNDRFNSPKTIKSISVDVSCVSNDLKWHTHVICIFIRQSMQRLQCMGAFLYRTLHGIIKEPQYLYPWTFIVAPSITFLLCVASTTFYAVPNVHFITSGLYTPAYKYLTGALFSYTCETMCIISKRFISWMKLCLFNSSNHDFIRQNVLSLYRLIFQREHIYIMPLLHIDIKQEVQVLLHVRKGPNYSK